MFVCHPSVKAPYRKQLGQLCASETAANTGLTTGGGHLSVEGSTSIKPASWKG